MRVEQHLQLLVGKIDTQLVETVFREHFEPKNVQNTNARVSAQPRLWRQHL